MGLAQRLLKKAQRIVRGCGVDTDGAVRRTRLVCQGRQGSGEIATAVVRDDNGGDVDFLVN